MRWVAISLFKAQKVEQRNIDFLKDIFLNKYPKIRSFKNLFPGQSLRLKTLIYSCLDCITFGCLIAGHVTDVIVFKICLSLLNIIVGIIFITLYIRHVRSSMSTVRREKKVKCVYKCLLILCVFRKITLCSLY